MSELPPDVRAHLAARGIDLERSVAEWRLEVAVGKWDELARAILALPEWLYVYLEDES